MASGTGSHPTRISPRKFSEKIALLNKKEREANKKFEEIIKEVQATTKSQQHPQQLCTQQSIDGSSGLSNLQDELRSIGDGGNYQAVHADSLEEIEKVYENLMKSVGQYEDESRENNACYPITSYNGHTIVKTNYPSQSANLTGKQQYPINVLTNAITVNAPFIPPITSTETFYQQSNDTNVINATQTDLTNNHQQQSSIRESRLISCEPTTKNAPSGHDLVDACYPGPCELTQPSQPVHHLNYNFSQSIHPVQNSCRARVVSFGSASRHRYPCAASNLLNQQDNCHSSHQQNCRTENLNYHAQYLKEPSGERSRLKSCSDPQLHISPGHQHITVDSVTQCSRSENRLDDYQTPRSEALNSNEVVQTTMECCATNQQARSQNLNETPYKLSNAIDSNIVTNYAEVKPMFGGDQLVQKTDGAFESDDQLNIVNQMNFSQSHTTGPQEHLYDSSDTANTHGQLPGIKICTIEDDSADRAFDVMSRNSSCSTRQGDGTPPCKDGSLPDISNLKFSNKSTSASPERGVIVKKQQQTPWSQENLNSPIPGTGTGTDLSNGSTVLNEFCQVTNVNWSSYDPSSTSGGDVEMEIRMDPFAGDVHPQQQQYTQQHTTVMSQVQDEASQCWLNDSAHRPFAHSLPPKMNVLSNSDCGFMTSAYHHQHGNLMAYTQGDLCNNIMRSRSHNEISSIDQSKRSQHYPCNPTN
jgi:hypothetical protein